MWHVPCHSVLFRTLAMQLMLCLLLSAMLLLQVKSLELRSHFMTTDPTDNYLTQLQFLFSEILASVRVKNCLVIITDDFHHVLYNRHFYQHLRLRPQISLRLEEAEDLLRPHFQTIRVLKQMRSMRCDMHFVTLLNGVQAKRLLLYVHKHRILNTRQKFVFLQDSRILEPDTLGVWSSMVSSIFVKSLSENRFAIFTVPYTSILNGIVVTQHLANWKRGKRLTSTQLFPGKHSNLQGTQLSVVAMEHVPMVTLDPQSNIYDGLEVQIVRVLGKTLNFEPVFYASSDSETERWGRELPNGSYSGLLGQMVNRSARLAIGDLHLNKLYASVMDLSMPHSLECLTFLTPESLQDNTWKTLVQPFSGGMWAGVLLSLFMVGTIFYVMSCQALSASCDRALFRDVRYRASLQRMQLPSQCEDLFDNFANCLLLTYSMLMYVALPRMPRNWPLRMLTGWYWMYCILLTVIYRASFTAILANPAARVTIDTLEQLASSRVTSTVWGNENKKFFEEARDETAQMIGTKLQLVDDIFGVTDRIAKGSHAYYDNEYFLRYLRLLGSRRRADDEVLHVMRDCVVRMPIALGLEMNSPLKPHIDKYLQRLREAGLIDKWLSDVVQDLPVEEQVQQEALMDLRKFWSSFVALAAGYLLGICALLAEQLYFKYIVLQHPLYEKYNTRLYYNYKRRFARL